MKPLLKWVGGKTQILDTVVDTFPTTIKDYYEPFLGGSSVLIEVLERIHTGRIILTGTLYASDFNERLIWFYKNIQSHPEDVIAKLKTITDGYIACSGNVVNRKPSDETEATASKESYYYWIRKRYNTMTDISSPECSAMLLFINKTCFRGMYREGPNGFNIPYGNYKNPGIATDDAIRSMSRLYAGVVFSHGSFEHTLENCTTGDFVYMDPPYAPEKKESFVGYTANGFDIDTHRLLFAMCAAFKNKKIGFTMSNADTDLLRDNFDSQEYDIRVISCRRAIHSKNPGSKTNELLIVSVPNPIE